MEAAYWFLAAITLVNLIIFLRFNLKLRADLNQILQTIKDQENVVIDLKTKPLPNSESIKNALEISGKGKVKVSYFDIYLLNLSKYENCYIALIVLTILLGISSLLIFKLI